MTAVLVTGMSGVGKSTALAGLAERGWRTVDTDAPGWCIDLDWDLDAVRALLDEPRPVPLAVSGTVANQGRLYDRFDAVVLLSAPADVVMHRLSTRTTNAYGATLAQRDETLHYLRTVEPLLRTSCTVEIVTTVPPADVVRRIMAAAGIDTEAHFRGAECPESTPNPE